MRAQLYTLRIIQMWFILHTYLTLYCYLFFWLAGSSWCSRHLCQQWCQQYTKHWWAHNVILTLVYGDSQFDCPTNFSICCYLMVITVGQLLLLRQFTGRIAVKVKHARNYERDQQFGARFWCSYSIALRLSLWSVYYSLLSRLQWAKSFTPTYNKFARHSWYSSLCRQELAKNRRKVFRLNVGCAITQMICCILCPIWQGYDEVAHHYWIRNDRWGWELRLRMLPNTYTAIHIYEIVI